MSGMVEDLKVMNSVRCRICHEIWPLTDGVCNRCLTAPLSEEELKLRDAILAGLYSPPEVRHRKKIARLLDAHRRALIGDLEVIQCPMCRRCIKLEVGPDEPIACPCCKFIFLAETARQVSKNRAVFHASAPGSPWLRASDTPKMLHLFSKLPEIFQRGDLAWDCVLSFDDAGEFVAQLVPDWRAKLEAADVRSKGKPGWEKMFYHPYLLNFSAQERLPDVKPGEHIVWWVDAKDRLPEPGKITWCGFAACEKGCQGIEWAKISEDGQFIDVVFHAEGEIRRPIADLVCWQEDGGIVVQG